MNRIIILDFCRKFSQKTLSEKELVPVKALNSTCRNWEYIGVFNVELFQQIKSSSIAYNLKHFGSRTLQVDIVPNSCNIQILLKKCFLKNWFRKGQRAANRSNWLILPILFFCKKKLFLKNWSQIKQNICCVSNWKFY